MTNITPLPVDRAAMLRQFATLAPRLRLGFITAALHVHTGGEDCQRMVNMFAASLERVDRREARREAKRKNAA